MTKKTALITGSTSGIGLEIAKALADNGYNIVINGFASKEIVSDIINELSRKNVEVFYCDTDISKAHDVEIMFTEVYKKFNSIDVIVNNAGVQYVAPIESFPIEKWEQILATNLSSSFYTIKSVITKMKENGWGRIINIASAHGKIASTNKAAYVAAKHGLVGLSKVVALEVAEHNITSNCICPGFVLTDLVKKQINDIAQSKNITPKQAEIELLTEKHPSLKFIKPEDIANMVVYLCSSAADGITGTEISLDGGWLAR
jgi:3-hydroxybutyrate dehydrogenase